MESKELSPSVTRHRVSARAIAVVLSVAGVVAVIGFLLRPRGPMPADPPELANQRASPQPGPKKPTTRFQPGSNGDGFNRTIGGPFSSTVYTAADGTDLVGFSQQYPSSDTARRAIQRKIHDADKVIELGTMCDKEGRTVGERALLTLSPPVPANRRAVLAFRNGRELVTFSSASPSDVLEFERDPPLGDVRRCEPAPPR